MSERYVSPCPQIPPRVKLWTVPPANPHARPMDMQSDMARIAAINARPGQRYNNDNYDLTNLQAEYNTANSHWNQVYAAMPEPDKTNCYGFLSACYAAFGEAVELLQTAFGAINGGDAAFQEGENATDPNKTPKYNTAKTDYNDATNTLQNEEAKYTTAAGKLAQANLILANYG